MSYSWGAHQSDSPQRQPRRARWRDRSDTLMWLRWWRARISGYRHMRGRRRRKQ